MSKNEEKNRVKSFDQLIEHFNTTHSKKAHAILLEQGEEDPDAFMVNFFKLAEYVRPKLQRNEMQVEDTEIKVNLHHVRPKADDA